MATEDTQVGAGASGSGSESSTGSAQATAPTSGQPQTQSQASGTEQARTGATSGQSFSYQEDRSQWVPPHRIREQSDEIRELKRQLSEFQGGISERDRKIAALAGLEASDPQDAQRNKVREAFLQMFPEFRNLLGLTEDQVAALQQVPEYIDQTRQAELAGWTRHGDTQMALVSERIAQAYGMDALSPDQQGELRDSFARWLRTRGQQEIDADATGRYSPQNPPPSIARYERGDVKLIDEFVADHTKRWVEPARRAVTAQTTQRIRPVVNSGGRAQVTSIKRPEKFASLDERIAYAAELAKERGVSFAR